MVGSILASGAVGTLSKNIKFTFLMYKASVFTLLRLFHRRTEYSVLPLAHSVLPMALSVLPIALSSAALELILIG